MLSDSIPNLRLFLLDVLLLGRAGQDMPFFSLVKLLWFSSPQPRLNNSRAINYIPNWIPICFFAMYSSKTFYLSLLFRFHKIRQYYEKISTSVQAATRTCRQQNSNFHPILGESDLRLIFWLYFFFQPLMLTVDKELSSGKFKLNVFKSDYLSTEFIVYLFRFWKCFINICFFFTFLTLDIRDLKSRLGQTAKALGLVSPFNTFYYIHATVRLRAVSYFSFESQWTDSAEHT